VLQTQTIGKVVEARSVIERSAMKKSGD